MGAKNLKVCNIQIILLQQFHGISSNPQAFHRVEILIHSHEIEGGYVSVQMGLLNDFKPIM